MELSWSAVGTPLLGGVLIGVASAMLMGLNGRIAGVSWIFGGLLRGDGDRGWRAAFLAGLVAGGVVLSAASPGVFAAPPASLGVIVVAGLLVGFGTQMANGCTSGHGVCGIGRFSPRSVVATLTFIGTGAGAVALQRLLAEVP